MLKFIFGLFIGFILAMYGEYRLEKTFVKEGIAKILGKFYRITPLNDDEI